MILKSNYNNEIIFEHLCKKSDLKLKIWPGKHEFSKAMRNKSYQFLEEKLK